MPLRNVEVDGPPTRLDAARRFRMRMSRSAPPNRVVLGLGNPGARYEDTRHNLGFRVVELLGERRRVRLDRRECNALVGWDGELTLAAPQTFMNRSGAAARCLVERYGFAPEEMLVVFDDVHLPLGRLRLRPRGSPGGHRGMESVLARLGTAEVPRLRLGVAPEGGEPPGDDLVEFVLSPFRSDEREAVEEMVVRAADACETWAAHGAEDAMQRHNG